jgi:hypothetical protein
VVPESDLSAWTLTSNIATNDLAYGVATDGFGNAYVAGSVYLSTIDEAARLHNWDMFVMKVNKMGSQIWRVTSTGVYAEIR